MPKDIRHKGTSHPWLKGFWELGLMLTGGVLPLLRQLMGELSGQLEHYVGMLERRLAVLALCGFTLFLAISSIWVGALFIAVDNAGIPRGVACLGGGLFVLVLLLLIVQLTKPKGRPT